VEMTHCRKVVKELRKSISSYERRYGMDTDTFLQKGNAPGIVGQRDSSDWQGSQQELRDWEKRLKDYEAAYQSLDRL
jgi:hypothetical protein